MPMTPLEITPSKVWAIVPVVTAACGVSPVVIKRGLLAVPIGGSHLPVLAGCAIRQSAIGAVLFGYARPRFRASITRMA